jgi:uncharacterized protein (TIGR02172 family)
MDKGALIDRGRTAEIFEWGDHQILKLFRDWCPDTWVDHELKIARIVEAAGLPVPAVEDKVQVGGRSGIIYERVSGPSMLAALRSQPWKVATYGRLMANLHAAMHQCAVPGLPNWREDLEQVIRRTDVLSDLTKQAVLRALAQLPDVNALCHGDFHPGNIIMSPRGAVVIDWTTAKQGHPLADVARSLLLLRAGDVPPDTAAVWLINLLRNTFQTTYLRRYMQLQGVTTEAIEAWQLPIAAARLAEDIPAERARLLRLVERHVLQPAG